MMYSFKQVFRRPGFIVIAFCTSLSFFVFGVWLPVRNILAFGAPTHVSFSIRAVSQSLAWELYSAPELIGLNISATSLIFLSTMAVLVGVNIAMTIFYFRQQARVATSSGLTTLGMLSGIVGIGCAACGSVIISSLIGFSAATAVIGFLPLKGLEFTIGAIILLIVAILVIAHKIAAPVSCHVTPQKIKTIKRMQV